jgi:hypothetical protein
MAKRCMLRAICHPKTMLAKEESWNLIFREDWGVGYKT